MIRCGVVLNLVGVLVVLLVTLMTQALNWMPGAT
jgi:hypothetical protein